MSQPEEPSLGESHRRILAALLRGFEDMRAEIERWIDPRPGALVAIEERLGEPEIRRLRELLDRLGRELDRMAREFHLEPSSRSASRSIEALLVEHLSLLEETAGGELAGYGALDAASRERLRAELDRLHAIFDGMLELVRRKRPRK